MLSIAKSQNKFSFCVSLKLTMPLTKEELEVMSYKDVVKLAQENGVYNRKSSKKAALIKKLSALWTENEEIENKQWSKKTLTPLREVDESNLSSSDVEDGSRRKTFTKVAASNRKSNLTKSTDPVVRQGTFTKDSPSGGSPRSPGNDAGEDRRKTFTKGEALSKTSPEDRTKCTDPPKRQRTFTKEDSSTLEESDSQGPSAAVDENNAAASGTEPSPNSKSTDPPLRQRTFTKDEDNVEIETPPSRKRTRQNTFKMTPDEGNDQENKPITSAKRLSRRSTFKFSPAATPPPTAGAAKNISTLSTPVRRSPEAATTPKTPNGIVKYEIPPATAPPIEKLSVFERLSVKLSSSARRSLVASERKSVNQTPTSAKRSNLEAIRSLRQNKTNPKNLRFISTRTDTTKTPNQPVIKQQAVSSTKKSSVKKPPNFSQIHKKNFAKMESLLENRSRIRDRAEALFSPNKAVNQTTSQGDKNRGGKPSLIPVLKADTKKRLQSAVAAKRPIGAVKGERQVLKGVRTNKRFQLQLSSIQSNAR
ncbi:Hypothetical protein NTJ_05850 [Nesidiocoris tenuis]|uniref:Rho termination factor N-terminal domain-containing protein n=1 Tax=Nesidiocoris tenuis TaxID=355587 RepID=A0ABN7ALC3_9HEMI|nr:Hypothetical protein NTJ_05850 [Nesidiocoris tenuis]